MRWLVFAALALFMAVPINGVLAHPHVWVQARAELVFDDQGRFTAVRNVWQFDEGFSAYASQGLDENGDGKLSREELEELAQINMDSLVHFEYFTYVQMGALDPAYKAPEEYWLVHDGELLTLFFTLPLKEPVAPSPVNGWQDLTVEIFDPTFFTDIVFVQDDPALIVNAPAGCSSELEPRKELDIFQSQLLLQIPADEDIPEDIAPSQGELSNTIRVVCGAS